jgi:hypothetical protein
LKTDNQLQAAVNILKGIRILEDYKAAHPEEAQAATEEQT